MTERLLSVHDLSHLTGWSQLTIYKKSAVGAIPGRVKLGFSLRFRESEVDAWLKAQALPVEEREEMEDCP